MKKLYFLAAISIAVFFFSSEDATAQDLHYSQFYNSPQNMNPALSGMYNGDKRFIGSLRDQWRWVPVSWFTFGGAYDQKIYPKVSENHFFSLGGNFNHDIQGASRISTTQVNVTGTYSHLLNKENILTGGLTLGFGTRGFDLDDLTWNNQWNGVVYDPTTGAGENFNTERINYFESILGLNYRWQKSTRTHIDIGGALFHLVRPSAGFYDNEEKKLPRNLNLTFIGRFQLADFLDLQFNALQQIQEEYSETLLGGLAVLHINQDRGKETELHVGLGYRTTGSIIPTAAIKYKNMYFSGSYDIDGTDFNDKFNTRQGAIEFHFSYIITDVKTLKAFKTCPIY